MERGRTVESADRVSKAKQYASLSNLHDLESIGALIADDCLIYGNEGKTATLEGMRRFRERFKNVFWVFHWFDDRGEDGVAFAFDRYWTDPETGAVKKCSATETVLFDAQGKIRGINYMSAPTDPEECGGYPEGGQVVPT